MCTDRLRAKDIRRYFIEHKDSGVSAIAVHRHVSMHEDGWEYSEECWCDPLSVDKDWAFAPGTSLDQALDEFFMVH